MGLGLGLPIVSIITQIVAYRNLTTYRETSWDKSGGFVVSHQQIGGRRIVGAIVFALLVIALIVIGTMPEVNG